MNYYVHDPDFEASSLIIKCQPESQRALVMLIPYSEGAHRLRGVLRDLNRQMSRKIRLIFTTNKVGQFFSSKSKTPKDLSADLVYKFSCSQCGALYVGETR